jgi:hypothetical protein
VFFGGFVRSDCLSSEAVQGPALPLEGVNDVESRHGLAAGVLGVGDCITDDILQEHLENPPGLLVDQARDALDPSTASQSADSGLGDALDVVPQNLPVPLGSSLACRLDSSMSANSKRLKGTLKGTTSRVRRHLLLLQKEAVGFTLVEC